MATQPQRSFLGVGIAIGVGIGSAIGVAMDNLPIGIAIGLGVGVAFGAAMDAADRKKRETGGPKRDSKSDDGGSGTYPLIFGDTGGRSSKDGHGDSDGGGSDGGGDGGGGGGGD